MAVSWQVITGDCLAVMRDFAPGSFDAVITDPPYGLDIASGGSLSIAGASKSAANFIKGDWDKRPSNAVIQDLLRVGRAVVIWGDQYFADALPASGSWLVWYKRLGLPEQTFADAELAWTNLSQPVRVMSLARHGFIREGYDDGSGYHITQKPLALMRWCIEQATEPGQTVLDPFCGSGTTGVACAELGRDFVGIEIDPSYAEIARRRIEAATRQGRLELTPEVVNA